MSKLITEEMRRLAGITDSAPDFQRFDRMSLMHESAPELEELEYEAALALLTSEEIAQIDSEVSEAFVADPKTHPDAPTQWLSHKMKQVHVLQAAAKKDPRHLGKALGRTDELAGHMKKHGFGMHASALQAWSDKNKGVQPFRGGASSRERSVEWRTHKQAARVDEFAPILAALGGVGRAAAGVASKVAGGVGRAAAAGGKAIVKKVGTALADKTPAPSPQQRDQEEQVEKSVLAKWSTGKYKKVKGGKEAVTKGKAKVSSEHPETQKEPEHPQQNEGACSALSAAISSAKRYKKVKGGKEAITKGKAKLSPEHPETQSEPSAPQEDK